MSLCYNFRQMILILSGVATSLAAPSGDNSYVLRPNDTVNLSVYEEPDLSVDEVKILKSGHASFPLIGSLEIGGLSITVAAEAIRAAYARDYLVDPKLTLTVKDYTTDYITIIGQVKQPGQVPIPQSGHLDLGTVLASAGGVTETADISRIQVLHPNGRSSTFTLAQIQGEAGRIKLNTGDKVVVQESRFAGKSVTILGKVEKPGAIEFPINGRLDLVTAIAKAGGLDELANPKKLTVNRRGNIIEIDFRDKSQRGGETFLLEPDDIISVPERLF